MRNNQSDKSSKEFLAQRAIRFFNRYGDELESISQLLKIRLEQLALAYTLENDLPREAIHIHSRVKTLKSFLKKLEKKDWQPFYYPSEVATDLIGARVVCWFLDDCYGMFEYIEASKQFQLKPKSKEDYIAHPKESGYRSIHLLADIAYDRVKKVKEKRVIVEDKMICEIQIRTKLQDAWGEFTHEMHYKVPGRFESDYETLVAEIANRLSSEDKSALAIRNILQKKIEEKEHEGFRKD
jgi:putative GTP pyrophosphokinase